MVSTNPVWAALPFAYASFLGTLAEHFRVIAPDTRGSGKSVHPGGPIPAALLADDVAALIEALNLDRPLRSPPRCWPTTSRPSSRRSTWTGR
jgi:pimeloyl-ACP methyl ester carboxylesterase